ncbi:sporulation inhibitor of replication protein SirA [Lentibacillus sediminis]|uniref:sporulation inhibitor of replication protein SirA n=1 Tax=Lentibacillus sediminis TaxID=1940529 RepID=UPI0013043EE7|nr:sporulation inhibitor of replication protein SirA [Lentibacillus sediminis]
MYEYSIFWIKPEVAARYFHKSGLLYRFIKLYQSAPEREDVKAQFNYITHPFPPDLFIARNFYLSEQQITIKINGPFIDLQKDDRAISLQVGEKQIKFRCNTLQDAEELLFPALRAFQPVFFITGNTIENYGWTSPLPGAWKERQHVLYSYH